MEKKLQSAAFYGSLAVCLTAVAVAGWFLLFGKEQPVEASAPVYETVTDEPAPTTVEEPAPAPVEMPTVEVIETAAPAEMEEEPIVEEVPVIAEPPRLTVDPVEGEVVAAFSVSELQYDPTFADWRIHDGVDIAAPLGTAVLAAAAGTVLSVTEDDLMGITMVIEHADGTQTTYANLDRETQVLSGAKVGAGEVIGAVGDTALAESGRESHLHFSVSRDGDAVDPMEYLAR